MTKKLYLDHQYLREFSSTILQKVEAGKNPGIILEQTLFYPASGGQPRDTGTVNDIPVLDVFEDEKHGIVHLLAEPVAGEAVEGRINWQRRFDHMQQHTGQHLLSQAFMMAGNAATVSFHMGDESSTLDLNQGNFSIEAIAAVEDLANQIIYENRPVMSRIIRKNELDQYPVRKLPSVDDNIRIVEIKDFDYSPCGGTHCSKTGEIGIVKIRRFENYKGGSRIHFLCGLRALKDYQEKSNIIKQIGDCLSAGETDLYNNIKKYRDELKSLRREHSNLNKRYLNYEAQALFSERKEIDNINIIVKIFEDRHPKELKILAQKVLQNFPDTLILFGAKAEGKASLFFLRSEGLACDMGKLMQDACAVINGRGGGRPQQAQGGGPATDKLDAALQCAYLNLAGILTGNK
ncbi:Alanyl-tRNA synthetase family protein [Olavius sp. associated proteobacterium Delta 1]|nr:Alanyl-tRNA synthetase family protein [Olavius sp. associated proteobacterium Delta 1]